ncbi:MAG TPA: sigma-54-dependent Fis family transcriptional regulator [Desulfotomaculum sp.]|nr:MAG: Fis family transcriptional regulator [Desulfotomaculum sp. BICA1-6]HBX23541.1 sigma-54-dependent Fis family transcriptional regulator [Desulfotomaculum sp.]
MVLSSTGMKEQKKIEKRWENFIHSDQCDLSMLNSTIASSWQRCKKTNVNPLGGKCNYLYGQEHLKHFWENNKMLMEVAKPVIESVFYTVQGSGFMVVLVDNKGTILKTMGDYQTLSKAEHLNFGQGAVWSEESVGTNAIGTSLVSGIAIQITGAEHFCYDHHVWTCSAAPIRDPGGHILGCLDMSGPYDKMHPHTLGMIVAATQAIESQLRKELSQTELELAHQRLARTVDTITDGIIYINNAGVITGANIPARNFLRLLEVDLRGMLVDHVLGGGFASRYLSNGRSMDGEYFVISAPTGKLICAIKAISDGSDKIDGAGFVICIRKNSVMETKKYCRGTVLELDGITGIDSDFGKGSLQANGRATSGIQNKQVAPFKNIVGCSQPIAAAINLAQRAAACSSTVLLLGESGSGKEVFAKSIHMASNRCQGPFIPVNCASLPSGLIQSELFGYSGGSFTGAKRSGQPGKFELAHGGTLFLDEIGDMALDMQANLLRVLQEKSVMRVGGKDFIPVDVRVIAATNKNLYKRMQEGNFREDLFYRINVLCIEIPSLRERGASDLQLLTQHLFTSIAAKLGRPVCKLDPSVLQMLAKYHWPGNVRELSNVLEQMLIITDDEVIRADHLPRFLQKLSLTTKGSSKEAAGNQRKSGNNQMGILEQMEQQAIKEALQRFSGNISQTARALGIGRNTLYEKLKKLNLKY